MRKDRRRIAGAGVTALAVAAMAVGAGSGSVLAQDTVLRISMGSPGEAGIRVWEDLATQFEAAHAGVDVQLDFQDDDLYETIGLLNALASPNPNILIIRSSPSANAAKTRIMIAAAAVITRPVV